MAEFDYPVAFIRDAIRRGIGPTRALREGREAGLRLRTQTWYRAFGEVQRAIADRPDAAGRPLNRRPVADELGSFTTVKGRGILQQIDVFVRDKRTGLISVQPFSKVTDRGVSRQAAIREALDVFVGNEDAYDEDVLGALPAGDFLMEPEQLEMFA